VEELSMKPVPISRCRALCAVLVATGLGAASVVFVVVPSGAAAPPPGCDDRNNNSVDKLMECVSIEGVREHQAAFQSIADANGGTRSSGTPGYDATVDYAVERLEAAGYQVTVQPFEFDLLNDNSVARQTSPNQVDYPVLSAQFDSGVLPGRWYRWTCRSPRARTRTPPPAAASQATFRIRSSRVASPRAASR
jgi:hypothetical protein